MKVGDLVHWEKDAWLRSQGVKPKIMHGILISERVTSTPNRKIWNVLMSGNGELGVIHESDLNKRVAS